MAAVAQTSLLASYRPLAGASTRCVRHPVRSASTGVTFNIYGDPQGVSRPWALDLVPLLIGSKEWAGIEHG